MQRARGRQQAQWGCNAAMNRLRPGWQTQQRSIVLRGGTYQRARASFLQGF